MTREPFETNEVVNLFTGEFDPIRLHLVLNVSQGDERVLVEVVKGVGLLGALLRPLDRVGVNRPLDGRVDACRCSSESFKSMMVVLPLRWRRGCRLRFAFAIFFAFSCEKRRVMGDSPSSRNSDGTLTTCVRLKSDIRILSASVSLAIDRAVAFTRLSRSVRKGRPTNCDLLL